RLDVSGAVRATGGVYIGGNLNAHLNGDGVLYRYGGQAYITVDDNLYIRDSGSGVKFHFDTDNGSLGIGGTGPGTSKLKIISSATDYVDTIFAAAGSGQLQFAGWSQGWNINAKTDGKHLFINRDAGADSNVLIGRSGKELFVRGSDGKVGIGTAAPGATFNVAGSEGAGRGIQVDNREIKFRGDGDSHYSIYGNRLAGNLTIENTSASGGMGTAGT
ncbi:MAG: hypothetical protein GY803_07815, partial [Chloroflexi bacterium]|nr:hypothetical protein [Chloroflexota bacterium]